MDPEGHTEKHNTAFTLKRIQKRQEWIGITT